jgi:hypothetical protein
MSVAVGAYVYCTYALARLYESKIRRLFCRHRWAYPLQACQKGCGATRKSPRNLEDKILQNAKLFKQRESSTTVQPLFEVLRERSDGYVTVNQAVMSMSMSRWGCCRAHLFMYKDRKFAADFFDSRDCRTVAITANAKEKLFAWLVKPPVVLELPIYKFPIFFGPFGLIECEDKLCQMQNTK